MKTVLRVGIVSRLTIFTHPTGDGDFDSEIVYFLQRRLYIVAHPKVASLYFPHCINHNEVETKSIALYYQQPLTPIDDGCLVSRSLFSIHRIRANVLILYGFVLGPNYVQ